MLAGPRSGTAVNSSVLDFNLSGRLIRYVIDAISARDFAFPRAAVNRASQREDTRRVPRHGGPAKISVPSQCCGRRAVNQCFPIAIYPLGPRHNPPIVAIGDCAGRFR